jgi:hypothetical protein
MLSDQSEAIVAHYRESYPGGGNYDPTDAMYLVRMLERSQYSIPMISKI